MSDPAAWWLAPDEGFTESADVVIVGSGAGGGFAAVTLAEAGLDVVLLEAGRRQSGSDFSPTLVEAMSRTWEDAGFQTMTGKPPIALGCGRTLGGSTVVNSAICFRTPERILDTWNEASDGAFEDTEAFYRTMDAVEAVMRVGTTPDALLSGLDRAHREAARAMGWSEHNFRRNTPTCVGCGRCNLGCPIGGKFSVDRNVLPRAAAAGARIYTRCQVDHVEPGRVGGYVVGPDGHRSSVGPSFSVEARGAVVLSAGTVGTPRLLLDSGAVDREGPVGRGLMIHPVGSVMGFIAERDIVAPGSTQGHYIDEFDSDDILLESNPTVPGAPFQFLPMHGLEAKSVLRHSNRFTSSGVMIRAQSTGRVLPSRGPSARLRFSFGDADRQRMVRGLRHAGQLWLEGLGADFVALNVYGSRVCRTMDDLLDEAPDDLPANRLVGYSSHPLASCSIGRACDRDGEVLEAPGIFCIDGSALPSNVGRNPQISIMTVSRVLAERLAVRLGRTPRPLWAGPESQPRPIPQPGAPSGVRGPKLPLAPG